jgi:hypothetical protein
MGRFFRLPITKTKKAAILHSLFSKLAALSFTGEVGIFQLVIWGILSRC